MQQGICYPEFYGDFLYKFKKIIGNPNFFITDEALIAEIMVWPNFFLMNVFFALKGSKLFIIILRSF